MLDIWRLNWFLIGGLASDPFLAIYWEICSFLLDFITCMFEKSPMMSKVREHKNNLLIWLRQLSHLSFNNKLSCSTIWARHVRSSFMKLTSIHQCDQHKGDVCLWIGRLATKHSSYSLVVAPTSLLAEVFLNGAQHLVHTLIFDIKLGQWSRKI